jgi:uncharacterized membrane protein
MKATLAQSTIPKPGSGSVALTVTAASTVKAGTYTLTLQAKGGGTNNNAPFNVVVKAATP